MCVRVQVHPASESQSYKFCSKPAHPDVTFFTAIPFRDAPLLLTINW